jgi:hypothetical protein
MNTPNASLPPSILTKNQKKTFRKELSNGDVIIATVRYDDECGNGHNSFSITGELYDRDYIRGESSVQNSKGKKRFGGSCGCLHDEIAKHFPELAPLIKWHLVSSDGPMHYVANTIFQASDRDHRGLLAGEKRQLVNGRTKQPVWERVMRDGTGQEVSGGSGNWQDSAEKPTETLTAAWEPVWVVGEGKARELDHARSSAVWPEATDAELMQDREALTAALLARLPALMVEFKAAVESLGFTY